MAVVKFSALVQTGPGAHPVSCTMGTGSFPRVESGRGVTLTPHPLLVLRSSKKSRAIPLLPLRAFVAYDRAKPTYTYNTIYMNVVVTNKTNYILIHKDMITFTISKTFNLQ
jgi:hypothetical protein